MEILEDLDLVAWNAEVDGLIQPEVPPMNPAPQLQTIANLENQLGATTAMTKHSEALTKYQEAAAKAYEEKCYVKLKAWNCLPKIQQNIILFGDINEDNEVST